MTIYFPTKNILNFDITFNIDHLQWQDFFSSRPQFRPIGIRMTR